MRAVMIHPPHALSVERFPDAEPEVGPNDVLVRLAAGGICGSDLHYVSHGGMGAIRIRESMALGHEAAGHVEAVGAGVTRVRPGDLVALNPSRPCGRCAACRRGALNHCEDMRFNGSAMRLPHEQGFFRERVAVAEDRVFPIDPAVAPAEAALCEPFAVTLHAAARAGDLRGRTALVTGCGPIGALAIVAARLAGAARVLAADITPHALGVARAMGADEAFDIAAAPDALLPLAEGRGGVDALFECSGSPVAFAAALPAMLPQGRAVLVGNGGDAPLPLSLAVARELEIVGSFRFGAEFGEAARLISGREVDLSPLISATYPFEEAPAAFAHAADKTRATKVTLTF